MTATSHIIRIDDLGRIVIAKEIRQSLNIRMGDPFEVYLDGDSIILKKYSPYESARRAVETALACLAADTKLSQPASNAVRMGLKAAMRVWEKEIQNADH